MEQTDGFFGWLGGALGGAIRVVVDALRSVLGGLSDAIGDFLHGLAGAVGMSPSIFNYLWLGFGLLLLWAAIMAAVRRSILGAILWAVLAVLVLGSLMGAG